MADAITETDEQNDARARYFSWITEERQVAPAIVGYSAGVVDITRDGDGWLAVLIVRPRLSHVWWTNAYALETWRLNADGSLTFVRREAPESQPWVLSR